MDRVGERAESHGGGTGAQRGLRQVAQAQRAGYGDGGCRDRPATAGTQEVPRERQENNCPAGPYPSLCHDREVPRRQRLTRQRLSGPVAR
ncbi:hypothetical protein GCM10010435_40130 [Winogradskya consettensis]|uniref:Uncharacterized protein n=1 Tax=Winogradskya consettensis TaxID=113560 RepID=A0A919VN16_9ACTN|nr:hypothetical protein Aco04nite_16260 [Actinoplanes consettensis]